MKKRASIDIDECLAEFMVPFCVWLYSEHKINLKRDQIHTYDLEKVLKCDRKVSLSYVKEFYRSELFAHLVPIEGAVDGIMNLKDKYDLIAVTGRPNDISDDTVDWLSAYFNGCFKDVYFTDAFSENKGRKGALCKKLGVGFHMDDNLEFALDCASYEIDVILLDAPWNKSDLPRNVVRAYSWADVPEKIVSLGYK